MRWILGLLVGWIAFAGEAEAQLRHGKPIEYQFIEALRRGEVDKAKGLAKLGNIDPHNIGGQPVISWVPRIPFGLLFLPHNSYSYLVDELKQSLDAPLWYEKQSLFATMCVYLQRRDHERMDISEEAVWNRAIGIIEGAIAAGVKTTAWPDAPGHMRGAQPFPACIEAYIRYRQHPRASVLLRVLGAMADKGADVDYAYWPDGQYIAVPVRRAAHVLDRDLLEFLAERGAKLTFKGGDPRDSCRLRDDEDSTLARYLPEPRDADTARAQSFLMGWMALGGDVRDRSIYRRFSAGSCNTVVKSLKERALDFGQLTYAQMVLELEEKASQFMRPPARPASLGGQQQGGGGAPVWKPPANAGLSGGRLLTKSINLRGGAGLDGVIVGKMEPGTLVSVERMDGEWAFVLLRDGRRGWMHGVTLRDGSHQIR